MGNINMEFEEVKEVKEVKAVKTTLTEKAVGIIKELEIQGKKDKRIENKQAILRLNQALSYIKSLEGK